MMSSLVDFEASTSSDALSVSVVLQLLPPPGLTVIVNGDESPSVMVKVSE